MVLKNTSNASREKGHGGQHSVKGMDNVTFQKLGAVLNLRRNSVSDTPRQTASTVIIRNQPHGPTVADNHGRDVDQNTV